MSDLFSKTTIRKMRASDVLSVMRIAQTCELSGWTKKMYEQELANVNSHSLIAVNNLQIVGFAIAHLSIEQLEVLNIGVIPERRRKKIGESLLQGVLEIGKSRGARQCWLEVREKNESAQIFYVANNFKKTGKRLNYYNNPIDHAILMTLDFFVD